MKDWILTHKRLYFVIVGIIAFVAFALITLLGVKRMASAATHETSVTIPWGDSEVTIELGDYDYYLVVYDPSGTEGYADVILSDTPALVNDNMNIVISGAGCRFHKESYSDEPLEQSIVNGLELGYQGRWTSLRANYDVLKEGTTEVYSPSNPFVKPDVFSMDAPYFVYDSVVLENRLYEEYTQIGLSVEDMYSQYAKKSKWKYNGIIENMVSDSNAEYFVELNLTIEVPTLAYLEQLYIGYKSPIYTSYADDIVENSRECMLDWYGDAKAPKHSYTVEMPWPVTPDSNGRFSIEFTLDELLTYIRYFNPDGKEIINDMPAPIQALWISFAHIESLRGCVITHLDGQKIYGRFTHNEFCRGDYSLCLEVVPNENYYDMTESEFDEYFERIYKEAHDKYIKDMQDSIDEIQKELDGLQSINGAFGDLGASDVWSGFVSTVSGLSSMGSAVRGLAVLTGSVFAFLPFQISSFMSFTILAICIIAIIKAIRG